MTKVKVEIKDISNLSLKEINLMNRSRIKEFGKREKKNYKKDYPDRSKVFFVKEKDEIGAFGILRPINIFYLGREYKILGICSIISVQKGKGYGKELIQSMINYLKKRDKTGLGFTVETEFFRKVGLSVEKRFIKRFVYKNPETGEETMEDDIGDGIYYNGKDNFIKTVLKNNEPVLIDIVHW